MLIPWKTHQLFAVDIGIKVLEKESQMQTLKVIAKSLGMHWLLLLLYILCSKKITVINHLNNL
jgi:hypothetical protein